MTTEQSDRLRELLHNYAANQAAGNEINELLDLLDDPGAAPVLQEFVLSQQHTIHTETTDWEALWHKIEPAKVRSMKWRWISVAASILLLVISAWIYFSLQQKEKPVQATIVDVKPPEANNATITLGDGTTVTLNKAANGSLATQGEVKVVQKENGQIVYEGNTSRHIYNTLSNPKGSRVIDITLADGSRVWLNAGSSINYPVSFTGNERKVSITGEAYFEVARDANKPFKVGFNTPLGDGGKGEVTVLGTHFNVNAFDDEKDARITLLEGSVKVARHVANDMRLLSPGDQAIVTSGAPININESPDVEQVMAWKNGRFIFKGNDIETIMRQVARWYNVTVVYNGKINDVFYAEIPRNTMASDVLKALELTGKVHFVIEEKKIIVNP